MQALCDALEATPEADRPGRLEALEPDGAVRAEALSLLQALRDEAAYTSPEAPANREPAPDVVGGVRLLALLGSGGSGEVYRGVRVVNGTEQVVAVKLFHAHRADAEDLVRFAREQRMLATLTHPDIVRFLDAGVTDRGRPYLVMDLAEGAPITTYCDDQRLRLATRLQLFLSVCDAVQSAHRQLIVHLDLKPSNILVSADGRVKLLDFGTAKLADPAVGFTRTEPLTLQYASPERLRGEPVSVACDVYSLGLILYELTSGAWPFRRHDSLLSVAERAAGQLALLPLPRVVTEEGAAARSSTLDRLRAAVRGDLEAIAAKALAHEPSARYASVSSLAEDLRRHLAGEPVRARPPGAGYLLRTFLRRHAWESASASLLIVGLAGAATYSAAQARSSRLAAERAQTQNRFLTSVFTLAGNDATSRSDMTVRQLLGLADERIAPVLGGDPAVAADVESTLALGYISQHAFDDARRLFERAMARAAAAGDVAREAEARASLSYVAYVLNRNAEATAHAQRALAAWTTHRSRFTALQAVSTLKSAAITLSYVNTTDPTPREYFAACLEIADASPDDIEPAARAECLRGLAIVYANIDSRYDEADQLLREAVTIQRANRGSANALSSTLQMLGLVNRYRGRFAEDELAQREAYEIASTLLGADSVSALWQQAIWATSLCGVGRFDEASDVSHTVLLAARKAYPARGSYLLWTPLIAAASASCLSGRDAECETLAGEAIETLGPRPDGNDPRLHAARGLRGLVLARRGQWDEAGPLIESALAMEASRRRTSALTNAWRTALSARPR